jgi:hypothetical protein
MWPVYCTDCGQLTLTDCRQITRVVNLAQGVIAVEAQCPLGHRIPTLTGSAVLGRSGRDASWTRRS